MTAYANHSSFILFPCSSGLVAVIAAENVTQKIMDVSAQNIQIVIK